jgi:hypothetical protein
MLAPIAAFRDSMQIALRSDSGAVRADSLFMRYRGSLEELVRVLGKMLEDSSFHTVVYPRELRIGLPLDSLGAVTADSVIRFLSLRGIWTYRGEGGAHFYLDESALQNTFGRFLTEEAQGYLHLTTLEQTSPTGADASLMISWDELAERLARTDRFLAMYPDAVAHDLVRIRYLWYLRWYLRGSDNTSVFVHGSRVLEPRVRQSYERYIVKYGATLSGELIRGYLEVLRANDYRDGDIAVEYLRKKSGLSNHDLPRRRSDD